MTNANLSRPLHPTNAKLLLGIDIAKATFDVHVLRQSVGPPLARKFKNHAACAQHSTSLGGTSLGGKPAEGLRTRFAPFIRFIDKLVDRDDEAAGRHDVHAVMEATGTYHLPLAHALSEAGVTVSIINPLQIKRFGQVKLRRGKTDPADAKLIAEYASREPMRLFVPTDPAQQQLKQTSRLIAGLTKQKTALGNMLHATAYLPEGSPLCREELEALIRELTASIRRLEKELTRLAKLVYPGPYRLMRSIPGVGPKIAGALIGYAGDLSQFGGAKQLSAFMGIVPPPNQSGTKDLPRHISKMGHAHLRTLLFMGSVTAARHNASCKAMYERLRARGKPHKVATIAVANKLVRQVFAVVKSGTPYIGDYEQKYARSA